MATLTSYQKQLADPKWQRKRLEIFQRDNFTCKRCGSTEKELHVHHNYYIFGKDAWDYPDDCYLTLCFECHKNEDLNKEELKLIWKEIQSRKIKQYESTSCAYPYQILDDRHFRLVKMMERAESYSVNICNYAAKFEDHKGGLTIYWRIIPSSIQKKTFEMAWQDVGEVGMNVTHEVNGNPDGLDF